MANSASLDSQALGGQSLNLTTLTDVIAYLTHDGTSTNIEKTGNTGVISITPTPAYSGTDSAIPSDITTTDGTPSDITNGKNMPYNNDDAPINLLYSFGVAAGEQTAAILFDTYAVDNTALPIAITVRDAASNILIQEDLTGITNQGYRDKYLIFTLTSDASETWTVDIETDPATTNDVWLEPIAAWITNATGGGGISIPVVMNHLRNQGIS